MDTDRLFVYRRNLPHWRLRGATYFVTFRLHRAQRHLLPEERAEVFAILRRANGSSYALDALVVMDDHVHAVVKPAEGILLERVVHAWKSISAKALQRRPARTGALWQREAFDRIVRDEAEWFEKVQYVANNPFKRWPQLTEYPWVDPRL